MGCICARPADVDPQHSPAVANNAAWSPTRAPHVQGAGTMATYRPGAATPQPLVRPSKSGAREASRSDSGDDEIGADFGGHIHMRSLSTASGNAVNLNGSQGGAQGQQQSLGGSTSGAGSSSFPHLVAIQHLRNQQQAETAARAAAETPKNHMKVSVQSKKMALLGGGVMNAPSGDLLRTATPQSSGDERTVDTHDHSVAIPTLFTVSGGGSLSQASIPPISPRRHKDKKDRQEKQEKQEKRDKRERKREKRSKKHRGVGGGSITESMHCDPSHSAGGGALIHRRNSSLAGSMSSVHSSSCGSAAFVDMSTSGCSQPDHASSVAAVTIARRYTNLDLGE
jgi:hypothetical protein